MDIMGLSRRLFDQLGQTATAAKTTRAEKVKADDSTATSTQSSALTARLQDVAQKYNVKSLAISDLIPLQEELKNQGFIGESQLRAQGLLPQLAYHHYESGPMDVEVALKDHLGRLQEKPAVLADHHEGRHMLNLIRNLASARPETETAA